jgi:hypothetical protein
MILLGFAFREIGALLIWFVGYLEETILIFAMAIMLFGKAHCPI